MHEKKKARVLLLFSLITLGFLIFIFTLVYWARIDRRLPQLHTTETNTALRGSIISKDNFTIATSRKLYKVVVDTRNIDKNKKELFIKLYSIYSGDDPKKVRKYLSSRQGNVVLSYSINAKRAAYLKELARKLYQKGVFVSYQDKKTGLVFLRGMSIIESGENRHYPAQDTFTPFAGYIKKVEKNNITKIEGVKGLEKKYEDLLNPVQNEKIEGLRDIGNNLIITKNSYLQKRIDGYDIKLTVSLKIQKIIERILDEKKEFLKAKEIVAAVMKNDGQILAFATSNRYNPDNINIKDYERLNPSAIEAQYEPGSVMKPIVFSLLLKDRKINQFELVDVNWGKHKIGRKIIKDTHGDKQFLSAEDIIVHSSNVGMSKIAQRFNAIEFSEGLKSFGFGVKTDIDLPFEITGNIPNVKQLKSEIYKATTSYGYGIDVTFIQLLQAYNIFNNDGKMATPYLVEALEDAEKRYVLPRHKNQEVIPLDIAKRMKRILIKTVEQGTGKKAKVDGIIVGGKTGTAHITIDGSYENVYNGSFFGFADDNKNKFTIGVLVREPKKPYYYFGSSSAAPIFKQIVEALVEEQYLLP